MVRSVSRRMAKGEMLSSAPSVLGRVVVSTENPVGFLQSKKVARHGFEIVAIGAIDLESLARNA